MIYLSHVLSEDTPTYGDKDLCRIDQEKIYYRVIPQIFLNYIFLDLDKMTEKIKGNQIKTF